MISYHIIVQMKKVIIYIGNRCVHCDWAIDLLQSKKVKFTEYNICVHSMDKTESKFIRKEIQLDTTFEFSEIPIEINSGHGVLTGTTYLSNSLSLMVNIYLTLQHFLEQIQQKFN